MTQQGQQIKCGFARANMLDSDARTFAQENANTEKSGGGRLIVQDPADNYFFSFFYALF